MSKQVLFLDGAWQGTIYPVKASMLEHGAIDVQTLPGKSRNYTLHTVGMGGKAYTVATIKPELDSRVAQHALRQRIEKGDL